MFDERLVYALVAAAALLALAPWIIGIVRYAVGAVVSWLISDKMIRTSRLEVQRKLYVPANRYSDRIEIYLDRQTPPALLVRSYPPNDMWVLVTTIKIGPMAIEGIGISVAREVYNGVAPGDEVDNPHFGEFNPDAWVDPRLLTQQTHP